MVIYDSWFAKLLLSQGYCAITLWPFILIAEKTTSEDVIRHEKIHLEQQLETLVLGFYLLYLLFFLWSFLRLRNWNKAYLAIPFEQEAHKQQDDEQYLFHRRRYAWCHATNLPK